MNREYFEEQMNDDPEPWQQDIESDPFFVKWSEKRDKEDIEHQDKSELEWG